MKNIVGLLSTKKELNEANLEGTIEGHTKTRFLESQWSDMQTEYKTERYTESEQDASN